MAITVKTRKILWAKSGNRCALCRIELVKENDLSESLIIGEECHIISSKKNGPRGETKYSNDFDGYDNLILLCANHHKEIDTLPIIRFSVEELRKIKISHENWIKTQLSSGKPWDYNISQISYINVPRLSLLASTYGHKLEFDLKQDEVLHDHNGMELVSFMVKTSSFLRQIKPLVFKLTTDVEITDDLVGLTCEFNDRFRTRNMPYPSDALSCSKNISGNLEKDPYIYQKVGEWKLFMFLDPKWVTTTTAFSEFSPSGGHRKFAGLYNLKFLDEYKKNIFATPLIIGFPRGHWDLLEEAMNSNQRSIIVPEDW